VAFVVEQLHDRLPASWRLLDGSEFMQEFREPPPGGDPVEQAKSVLRASLVLQGWIGEWSGECFGCRLIPVWVESGGDLLAADLVVFSELMAEYAVLLVREPGDAGAEHAWCVRLADSDPDRLISSAEVEAERLLLAAIERARHLAASAQVGGDA